MAYSLKVTDAKRDTIITEGVDFLEVSFDILEGKKVIESRKQSFPVGTPDKEVQAALKRYLAQYVQEKADAEKNAERDAASAADQDTISKISNLTIDHEVTIPKRSRKG